MLDTIFLVAAIVGGTVMVCQFLLMCLGMGDDASGDVSGDVAGEMDFGGDVTGDVEVGGDVVADDLGSEGAAGEHATSWSQAADADVGHPDGSKIFEILSFRSLVAAVTFFGIAGKISTTSGQSASTSLLVALVAGAAAMYVVYWTMVQLYKLRSSGNQDIRIAVGELANVYVAIPGQLQGMGKVHLTLQSRTVEYQAVTEHETTLQSGASVVIVDVLGSDKVLVAAASEGAEANL